MSMMWSLPLAFIALTARKFIGKVKGLLLALASATLILLIEQYSINTRFIHINPENLELTYKDGTQTKLNYKDLKKFWSISSIKHGHRCYLLIKAKNNISYRSMSIPNTNNICIKYATKLNKKYYL